MQFIKWQKCNAQTGKIRNQERVSQVTLNPEKKRILNTDGTLIKNRAASFKKAITYLTATATRIRKYTGVSKIDR